MVNRSQLVDGFSRFSVHRGIAHMSEKLKKPGSTDTKRDPVMPSRWPTTPRFAFKQCQHGLSVVRRNHEGPAGSGPVFMLWEDSQAQGLFIPAGGCISIRNKHLHVIDLFHFEWLHKASGYEDLAIFDIRLNRLFSESLKKAIHRS